MSWTFVACVGIAFAWLGLFYLWGRSFLTFIKAERDIASSVCFGYLSLQMIYQIIYLPFYFSRGSYRVVSYIWMGIVAVASIVLALYLRKRPNEKKKRRSSWREKTEIVAAVMMVLGLVIYISLHVPFYGQDTRVYISKMNECYYKDSMWNDSGKLDFHFGMCSMFEFFTMPSLLTGIKPYYISLFTVRSVGIVLFSLTVYRIGVIFFEKNGEPVCKYALGLSVFVPFLLMFWGSYYTAEFFYWRINEAKGFCQFVLLPIGFSVFIEMFKNSDNYKQKWRKQILVGLSAVSVSSSSLTPYLFLVFMGTFALLLYDKFRNSWFTISRSLICTVPNLLYLAVYIIGKRGIISI